MFTGIVQGLGEVTQIRDHQGIRRIQVRMPQGRDRDLHTGASIAINGVPHGHGLGSAGCAI